METTTICFKKKIPAELHKKAKLKAVKEGITVPQIYTRALEIYLHQ